MIQVGDCIEYIQSWIVSDADKNSLIELSNASNELVLPVSLLLHTVIPQTILITCCIWIIYYVLYAYVTHHTPLCSFSTNGSSGRTRTSTATTTIDSYTNDDKQTEVIMKNARIRGSYQLMNLIINTVLGLVGLYYDSQLQQQIPYRSVGAANVIGMSTGYENNASVTLFTAFQLGYQFFSIPMGLFYVSESTEMLLHHYTVVIVCCMTGYCNNGFRYWTPFFYGYIELSSIPLSIMNAMKCTDPKFSSPKNSNNKSKDNSATTTPMLNLVTTYPNCYFAIRLLFCMSFLYIRLGMFVPRQIVYLQHLFIVFSSRNTSTNSFAVVLLYKVFMFFCFSSSFILLCLQILWGYLILKALFKTFVTDTIQRFTATSNSKEKSKIK